jgi:hypothetical protein
MYRAPGGLWASTQGYMSYEEIFESQARWEQDLEERWRAKELLKSAAAPDEARRGAQERLKQSPLDVPPSMQWAMQTRKRHAAH